MCLYHSIWELLLDIGTLTQMHSHVAVALRCFHCRKQEALSGTDLSIFALCIMGFSRFWLTVVDKEFKVHHRVIRMIFPMNQRAKNDRSVRRALPVYDSALL